MAILLGITLAVGILILTKPAEPEALKTALVLPNAIELPEFSLLDQDGKPVSSEIFRGHWNLLFFGFTHCPDVCPTTLQLLSQARNSLIENGATTVPRIVLLSVDPERDTPEVLQKYVDYFGADNLGLTGELAQVRVLTSALGIFFEKSAADGEDYGVDHSAAVLVINPNAQFSALFSTPHSIENFVHDLPIVMTSK